MASSEPFVALDIGAGNGRAFLGFVQSDRIELKEIHRFEHGTVPLNGALYWDVLQLWENVLHALNKAAVSGHRRFSGVGIDTFNCDFGLLDRRGNLMSNVLSYRDRGSDSVLAEIREKIDEYELYRITGAGCLSITALARFMYLNKRYGRWLLDQAATYLPLADLLRYFLTGDAKGEETILWGSQLVNIRTRQWDDALIELFGVPPSIFPPIVPPGTLSGTLKSDVRELTGVAETPVVAVAGHDTISASVAFVNGLKRGAFVSIGTWSVLGVLLDSPETSREAFRRGFLNEMAVNSIFLARNSMGFYLLESLIQRWRMRGVQTGYERLIEEAEHAPAFALCIDVNDPVFFSTVNAEETLAAYLQGSGQEKTDETGLVVRSILESLALSYARGIRDLEEILDVSITRLTVLGGGARNRLLCQMVADAADVEVFAGPAEATVMGNVAVQAWCTGSLESLDSLGPVVAGSMPSRRFSPKDHSSWKQQSRERGW